MAPKHLQTGEPLPPLKKDTLRVYSMRFCPYAQRTRLVLAHKKIPHETVNINLKKKPDWFLERNPMGLVPTLEFNDKVIYESAICNEFLDEKYPNDRLLPQDPYEKARAKILMEGFAKVITQFYRVALKPEEREQGIKELQHLLERYEKALTSKFFGGPSPSMIDLHIWPWVERFPAAREISGIEPLPQDRFPKLKQWTEDMKAHPTVKEVYLTPEQHSRFIKSHVAGSPEYDPVE